MTTISKIEVRGERPEDETAIQTVTAQAFGSQNEASIIRWMRAHASFDPRFSLCAWQGSRLVGHALFTPARVCLFDRTIDALAVGPVAVAPSEQRRGIGGCLLSYGHQLGAESGYQIAFLCGHPNYYPRHGYRAAFGFAKATLDLTSCHRRLGLSLPSGRGRPSRSPPWLRPSTGPQPSWSASGTYGSTEGASQETGSGAATPWS
jgi:putative acetyltransferase